MAKSHSDQSGPSPTFPGSIPAANPANVTQGFCDLVQANHCHVPCANPPEQPTFSELERRLLNAGITPKLLMEQWGIILWSIRPKSDRIKLKIQAVHPIPLHELEQWFAAILGQTVTISQKPFSECCFSPCKGCLWADPEKRAFWNQENLNANPAK